ncbi:hypothetical protein OAI36_00360 [Alphaproteobacteria bacterium]|nr:hypothetical protein [Alphaproteobacteria bacterium]
MPNLKKPRAKSPSKTRFPQKAPKNNYFSTLMETEEGRALRKSWSTKKRIRTGRPRGVPDGYSKEQIEPIRAEAKKEAERLVNIMADKFNIEDEYAKKALVTAVEVMNVVGETRERLAAARLVLDFTKQKPASKNEVSLSKAEDFLASLVTEENNGSTTKED